VIPCVRCKSAPATYDALCDDCQTTLFLANLPHPYEALPISWDGECRVQAPVVQPRFWAPLLGALAIGVVAWVAVAWFVRFFIFTSSVTP
jgi:hypothetical protein